MKYKAVYDVLNERRQTTPGFCYHDRSGWRAYPQTYMTMQCPLSVRGISYPTAVKRIKWSLYRLFDLASAGTLWSAVFTLMIQNLLAGL